MNDPQNEPLIAFIHVQRTGGRTLARILGRQYGDGYQEMGTFADYEQTLRRVREVGATRDASIRAIRGHMSLGIHHWLPDETRFITFVRDPVVRAISHYTSMRYARGRIRPFGLPPFPRDLSLEECVIDGRYILDNCLTRMLWDSPSPLGPMSTEGFREAVHNLENRLFFVGLSERFDESLVLLQSMLGLPRTAYRRVDEGRPADRIVVPDETRKLIEDRNTFDLELYRLARNRFDGLYARFEAESCFALNLETVRRAQELVQVGQPSRGLDTSDARALLVDARARTLVAELELFEERVRAARLDERRRDLARRLRHLQQASSTARESWSD